MEAKKTRIALFADVLEENFDGVSITLHKILRNAPADRFEFLVITPHPPKDYQTIPYPILTTRFINLPFQKGYRLGLPGKSLKKNLDEFKPDLIHFTSPSLLGKYAIKYGKKHTVPVISIYHTHFPAYLKYYIGKFGDFLFGPMIKRLALNIYHRADLTLVPTKPIKKDLVKLGVPKDKMKIWGRAIEAGSFNPDYRDESLFDDDIPRKHKKVLFVSRLIKEKDMPALVKIYKKLKKLNPKISMIITGEGPKKKWLEKRMKGAVFTGKKVGVELAQIYASSDVFLFPSSSETFGNVIIEAMASGLPVVSSNKGGPAELVKNRKNGFLIKSGKAKDFAKRIAQILDSPQLLSQMSTAARDLIESRSIESLHEQLWEIYERTIAEFNKVTIVASKAKQKLSSNGASLTEKTSIRQLNTIHVSKEPV